MDGNYSRLFPQRFERATGVISLSIPTFASLLRYLRRCWFERHRVGGLEGGRDSVKWEMIRFIAVTTPGNRQRNADRFERIELPKIRLSSPRQIDDFYRSEGLERRG